MGIAAGGNINPEGVSMFEPIGVPPLNTREKYDQSIGSHFCFANATISYRRRRSGSKVEEALIKALESGKIKSMSAGQMGLTTSEVGDLIASLV